MSEQVWSVWCNTDYLPIFKRLHPTPYHTPQFYIKPFEVISWIGSIMHNIYIHYFTCSREGFQAQSSHSHTLYVQRHYYTRSALDAAPSSDFEEQKQQKTVQICTFFSIYYTLCKWYTEAVHRQSIHDTRQWTQIMTFKVPVEHILGGVLFRIATPSDENIKQNHHAWSSFNIICLIRSYCIFHWRIHTQSHRLQPFSYTYKCMYNVQVNVRWWKRLVVI